MDTAFIATVLDRSAIMQGEVSRVKPYGRHVIVTETFLSMSELDNALGRLIEAFKIAVPTHSNSNADMPPAAFAGLFLPVWVNGNNARFIASYEPRTQLHIITLDTYVQD